MQRIHVPILSLVSLLAFGLLSGAEDRRPDKSVVVIMTLNAEFLWDGVEPEEGSVNFPWKNSQTEAEEHMARIAQIVLRSDPDILNLVEVENLDALTTFHAKFLAGRGYKPYLAQGRDSATGQDVALLTRIDPENETTSYDSRKGRAGGLAKAVSKNCLAKIDLGGIKAAFLGIHLLAIPSSPSRKVEREAQADAVRAMAVEARNAGWFPVVLGDFNDYDGSAESRDHVDSMPISKVLSLIRGMDAASASDDLVNAASFISPSLRYTAFYDANRNEAVDSPSELTSIDHILLSPELAAKVEAVEMPHHHDPRHATDHFPVVVRLRLGPAPSPTAQVRIVSLLPNPAGNENLNEEVTLKNTGQISVSLTGWKLRNHDGRTWSLDSFGTLASGEARVIKRNGQAMALRNNGDTVDLVDAAGQVVHGFTYAHAEEGEQLTPGD